MALGFTERLRIFFDVETQSFKQGVKSLKADLAAADGAVAKSKVGFAALGTQLSQYGAQAALAAGAALVAFGAKAVTAFNDAALSADDFANRSGIGVEAASRWIAVGDDFGISAEAIRTSFQRMNLAIEANKFEKFGLDVVRAADGTVDANATFTNTVSAIGKIPDATERARAAQEVFGRSWGDISRLMMMDAADLRKSLDGVSEAQIIDTEEVAKAKAQQAAMDNLGDAVTDLMLAIGEGLTPALTTAVEKATDLAEIATDIANSPLFKNTSTIEETNDSIERLAAALGLTVEEYLSASGGAEQYGENLYEAAIRAEYYESRTKAANLETWTAASAADAAAAATEEFGRSMGDARSDAEQYDSTMEGLNQRLVDAKEAVDNLVGEELSKIDAFQRAEDSARSYTESVENYVLASMDAEATEKDKAAALREAARDAVDAARDMATFTDGTYKSVDGLATQIQALKDMAAALGPNDPLRAELLAHIGVLEGIQSEIETDVKFDVDEASVADAKAKKADIGTEITIPAWIRIQNPTAADELNILNARPKGGGAMPVGGGAPNSMAPSGLLQGALDFFAGLVGGRGGGGVGGGSSSEPKASELFAKDMDRLRNMYEVGDLSPAQYVRRLQRLMTQPGYRFRRLSPSWMLWWREVQRAKADAKTAAEAATKPDVDVDDSAAWSQASENQAAIEAGRDLSSTQASSIAALMDDDTGNDASALDSWAQAIWRDIEARANRKFKNNRGRAWARFARAELERAIADNPWLASRLRVYLAGIPKFGGGGGDPDRPDTVAAGAPSGPPANAGGRGSSRPASSGGRDGMTVHVTISAPNAAVVDGKAVRAAIPAIAAELRRFERGQG
jgi:hypothetical protein